MTGISRAPNTAVYMLVRGTIAPRRAVVYQVHRTEDFQQLRKTNTMPSWTGNLPELRHRSCRMRWPWVSLVSTVSTIERWSWGRVEQVLGCRKLENGFLAAFLGTFFLVPFRETEAGQPAWKKKAEEEQKNPFWILDTYYTGTSYGVCRIQVLVPGIHQGYLFAPVRRAYGLLLHTLLQRQRKRAQQQRCVIHVYHTWYPDCMTCAFTYKTALHSVKIRRGRRKKSAVSCACCCCGWVGYCDIVEL